MALEDLKPGTLASQSVVCGPEHFASGIVAGTASSREAALMETA
jgi:hypothetical protein